MYTSHKFHTIHTRSTHGRGKILHTQDPPQREVGRGSFAQEQLLRSYCLRYLAVHAHLELLLLFGERYRCMVVQPLGHQLQGEGVLRARRLLDLGAFVLEPNLDLRLIQAQLGAQLLATSFGEVAVLVEFALQEREGEGKKKRESMSICCAIGRQVGSGPGSGTGSGSGLGRG